MLSPRRQPRVRGSKAPWGVFCPWEIHVRIIRRGSEVRVGSSGDGAKERGLKGRSQVFRQRPASHGPEWTPLGESRPRGLPGGGRPQRAAGSCPMLTAQTGSAHPIQGNGRCFLVTGWGKGLHRTPNMPPRGEAASFTHWLGPENSSKTPRPALLPSPSGRGFLCPFPGRSPWG